MKSSIKSRSSMFNKSVVDVSKISQKDKNEICLKILQSKGYGFDKSKKMSFV